MSVPKRTRLDQVLTQRGLVETRSRARDLILRGAVSVDGAVVTKPGALIFPNGTVDVDVTQHPYVSRGGLKLAHALGQFDFSPVGVVAIDVGASTGGFTDVLLRGGASRIYAVDVGRDQLHASLRDDPRVTVIERADVRDLTEQMVPEPITAVVCDVSFISLTKALPRAMAFASSGAWLVALIKPQFELAASAIGKGGIVTSPEARQTAVGKVFDWLNGCPGWSVIEPVESPITGKGGNVEFLIGARFDG